MIMRRLLLLPAALLTLGLATARANAQALYSPIELPASREVNDVLSTNDIPTGFGGFARDYTIYLEAGEHVAIDVLSDEFDTIVTLLDANGGTISENDDGPDGSTNSLLFARIVETGDYTIRVRAFGGQGEGAFYMKVARLREVE